MTRKKIYDEMTDVKQYPKSKINNKSTLNKMFMSEYADVIINLANDYIELNDIKEVHVMPDGVIMEDKKMKKKEQGSAVLSKDASDDLSPKKIEKISDMYVKMVKVEINNLVEEFGKNTKTKSKAKKIIKDSIKAFKERVEGDGFPKQMIREQIKDILKPELEELIKNNPKK